MRLLDFSGLTVSFYIFYFGDKGLAFWKAVICEKGKHSELAKAVSPSRALPLLATPLFCVVVGVNVLTGGGIRGVEEGGCADLLGGEMSK